MLVCMIRIYVQEIILPAEITAEKMMLYVYHQQPSVPPEEFFSLRGTTSSSSSTAVLLLFVWSEIAQSSSASVVWTLILKINNAAYRCSRKICGPQKSDKSSEPVVDPWTLKRKAEERRREGRQNNKKHAHDDCMIILSMIDTFIAGMWVPALRAVVANGYQHY